MVFIFTWYGDHRGLHLLTHSFPTRRSSDLSWRRALRWQRPSPPHGNLLDRGRTARARMPGLRLGQHVVGLAAHGRGQFAISAHLLPIGMEPPDEDAEGDDRPKEAQREAAYRRDQDRGEQRRLARRLLVERPRQAIVGRVGRARLVVVIGDIIAPVWPGADADRTRVV